MRLLRVLAAAGPMLLAIVATAPSVLAASDDPAPDMSGDGMLVLIAVGLMLISAFLLTPAPPRRR
ncbi:MAG: hypothetical protein ACJ761_08065, partial [Chloroflexota bacterium]